MLVGRIESRPQCILEGAEASELRVEVLWSLTELAADAAQLLGQVGPGVLGSAALGQPIGRPLEPLGLSLGGLALALALSERVRLRVRQDEGGHQQDGEDGGDSCRAAGQTRSERAVVSRIQAAQRIAALKADEVGVGRVIGPKFGDAETCLGALRRGFVETGDLGRADRDLEGRRDPIAKALLAVEGERRLGQGRPDADGIEEQDDQADDREGQRDAPRPAKRGEPRGDREDELQTEDRGHQPGRVAHDPAQPEPPSERCQAGADRDEGRIERHGAGVGVRRGRERREPRREGMTSLAERSVRTTAVRMKAIADCGQKVSRGKPVTVWSTGATSRS